VAAVKSALASVNGQVLRCYAHNCLDSEDQPRDETIADLIHLFEGTK
jgi:DNA-binding FrmR family transcriptional regulator